MRLFPFLVFTLLFFAACKGNTDTNTSSSTAANSNTAAAPAPSAPKEVPLPASLSKFKPLTLPFKLEKGLAEGDLDQLGWAVGTKFYFKTKEQVYATFARKSISDTDISFELQAYTPDGQTVGKAEHIQYFGGGASAEFIQSVSCELILEDDTMVCNCEDYIFGTNDEGEEIEETTKSTTKLKVGAKGIETIIVK